MPSLEQLTAPLTPEQVKSTLYSVLAKLGINVTSWKPGHPVRTLIAATSTLFSSYTYWSSNAVKSKFLTLARGPWLTATAKLDYGTERNEETFAEGSVTLRNDSPNEYDFDPEDIAFEYKTFADDGLTPVKYTYQNTTAITVPVGFPAANEQLVAVRCTVPGAKSSIPPNATLTLVPAYEGLSVSVGSPINGADEETDQSLIIRSQSAASAMSPNGPSDAYRYWATSVKVNGAPICTRVQVVRGNPLTVFLGNDSSGVTGESLELLKRELYANVVPLGVVANIVSGTNKLIYVSYTVWVRKTTTLSVLAIKSAIDAALANYFAKFPMGGDPVAVVDTLHPAGTRWMYFDSLKSVVETALNGIQGVTNPVFHAEVWTSYGSSDIQFNAGNIAILDGAPASEVIFE